MGIGVNKRSSIVYFKHEVSIGVPIAPASANDFMAVGEGFSGEKTREILNSTLIAGSIGQKKGQLGMQDVKSELPFEMKGKGAAGAPEYGAILETLLGAKATVGAQKVVAAGSTTTVLKLASTTGLEVGMAVLVKHAADDHEVRVIKAVDINGTDLTVEPALLVAPAVGVEIMAASNTLYKPANSGHKHGTVGVYWGNEVLQQFAGCLCESLSIEISAGQIATASAAFKGLNATETIDDSPYTPVFDVSEGIVGLSVECYLNDVLIDFPKATVKITNELAEILSAKEVSGKVSSRVRSRKVEVEIPQYLDSASLDNQDMLNNLTDFPFVLVMGPKDIDGNFQTGKTVVIYCPRNNFTAGPFGAENDIITEQLTFASHIGSGLPEVFIAYP